MKLTDWHWERQRLRSGQYNASSHEDACLHCEDDYKLRLGGIHVDTVTTVGTQVMENTCIDAVATWLQIADLPSRNTDPYIGGGNYQCAFWRTLTRDLFLKDGDFQRLDDPESYVAATKIWWSEIIDSNYQKTARTWEFDTTIVNIACGQQFFRTVKGYMGVGNPKPGDEVFLLKGSSVPFVLRPRGPGREGFFVVGDCYVHGIMDGEASGRPWETIFLY